MAFDSKLDILRRGGRKVVLPSDTIKRLVKAKIGVIDGDILDLGAGTQYWSKWLHNEYKTRVLAVDTFYELSMNENGIVQYNDYFKCVTTEGNIKALWCCDVLHHLDSDFKMRLIDSIDSVKYEYIIVKDIDCRHRFGNQMNRLHDLIINQEHVYDVDPSSVAKDLRQKGYDVHYKYIPKLWYPHFLIIAKRRQGVRTEE